MGRNFFDNPFILLVLVLIIVLVFGANRLPGAARSLGRSMRIFKSEVKEMKTDDASGADADADPPLEGRVVKPTRAGEENGERVRGDVHRDG